jgi:hypothetical protein
MKNIAATAFQYMIRVVAIDLVLAVIISAALWLLEHSLRSFGTWLLWAGFVTLAIGLLAVVGSTGITRSGSYAMGRTVGEQDITARTNADLKDEAASFSFLILAVGAGVLAVIVSQLF